MKEKIKLSGPLVKTAAAGFVLFLCALAFSPASQLLRTIPLFLVGGAVSFLLVGSVKFTLLLSGVMTLCIYLAYKGNVGEAAFFALISCLVSAAGIYIFRFVKTARLTQSSSVRKKCGLCAAGCFVVAVVLSVAVCGNAVSFVIHNAENTKYVRENYGKSVEKRYTAYEFLKGEYCTYVSFKDGDAVYGNADECYVVAEEKHFFDGVRNYREDKMLVGADAALAYVISNATWGYSITASDIAFEIGEILSEEATADEYLDRICYVVSFQTLFGENDRDKFAKVCEDTVSALNDSGFDFERIVLCGGDAGQVLFCAEITRETEKADVPGLVTDFDEELVESIGVTEMTILDYWNNK